MVLDQQAFGCEPSIRYTPKSKFRGKSVMLDMVTSDGLTLPFDLAKRKL